ncbi:cupin domain-containing protein [Acidipila sp. EB88]|uniref:cupin domain-containing protein n=1 Tax=Acidipila sp. EB88 TaxID=2305226 RepID=UPI000F5E6C7A|nr:cupin domain-containing protein [Acidipila sp. EB88]RRA49995.1 cupin [Acidipila sp. EB88]
MPAELSRRRFHRLLAAGLVAAPFHGASTAAETARGTDEHASPDTPELLVEAIPLGPIGWCPNNAALPVLFYHSAVPVAGSDPAQAFEVLFRRNGWPPQWRNGVYTFHHYHSTAHEVLGFTAGSARLVLGGPGGREVEVRAGDVLLLPTGTGHCELSKSDDFAVVGAYPPEQTWDICRTAPDAEARARMSSLPFPRTDPVQGVGGAVSRYWVRST